jgi:hypothetical protein
MSEKMELKACPIPDCGGEADGTYPVADGESWVGCSVDGCLLKGAPIPIPAWQDLPRRSGALREVIRDIDRNIERGFWEEDGPVSRIRDRLSAIAEPVRDDAPWTTLSDLDPGTVFETTDGIQALVTEYETFNEGSQRDCYLLASGECAHFEDGNDAVVRPVGEPVREVVPTEVWEVAWLRTYHGLIQHSDLFHDLADAKARYKQLRSGDIGDAFGVVRTIHPPTKTKVHGAPTQPRDCADGCTRPQRADWPSCQVCSCEIEGQGTCDGCIEETWEELAREQARSEAHRRRARAMADAINKHVTAPSGLGLNGRLRRALIENAEVNAAPGNYYDALVGYSEALERLWDNRYLVYSEDAWDQLNAAKATADTRDTQLDAANARIEELESHEERIAADLEMWRREYSKALAQRDEARQTCEKLEYEVQSGLEQIEKLEAENYALTKRLGERVSCDYLRSLHSGGELDCEKLVVDIERLEYGINNLGGMLQAQNGGRVERRWVADQLRALLDEPKETGEVECSSCADAYCGNARTNIVTRCRHYTRMAVESPGALEMAREAADDGQVQFADMVVCNRRAITHILDHLEGKP